MVRTSDPHSRGPGFERIGVREDRGSGGPGFKRTGVREDRG